MPLEEQLSALIGDVYDAALDPALWPAALAGASRFVGGTATGLYSKDATSKSGNSYYDDGGIERRYIDLYFEKYVKFDPTTTRHFFTEIGHSVSTVDIMPYGEFLQTRFYKEWAQPQHLVDHLSAVLDKSLTSVSLFGVFRHERDGLVDDETRWRMALIVPHVRRAVLIGRAMEEKATETAAFADTLDTIRAGMFLVDASGHIVHANVAGHELLATGTLLRGPSGRLTAADNDSDRALHDALAGASGGDTIIGTRGIALPLTATDGTRYVAHVLPLTSGARRRAGYAAVAALFVQKATLDQPSVPEVLLKAYGLTPTELRVLLAVVEIGGAPEVAEALGIAESTVKFHLKALFEKTGSHRQADLIKLVAGYASPVAG